MMKEGGEDRDRIPEEAVHLLGWPELSAEDRPRTLFVETWVGEKALATLAKRGWMLLDVRTMPNKTDGDRAECLKAWLEGVRLGSIQADAARLKHMELEAKIYGLVGAKESSTLQSSENLVYDAADMKSILDFGRAPAPLVESPATAEAVPDAPAEKRKRGRPKKQKNEDWGSST